MLELILGFNGHLLQRAPKFPRSFMGGGGGLPVPGPCGTCRHLRLGTGLG